MANKPGQVQDPGRPAQRLAKQKPENSAGNLRRNEDKNKIE